MSKKLLIIFAILIGVGILLITEFFIVRQFSCPEPGTDKTSQEIEVLSKPKAMMLLIEFKNTEGLVNMVNDMRQRNIKGLLMVNADFVERNKDVITKILKTGNIEIAASYDLKPYWEMTYDEQRQIITDMVSRIEKALGTKIRIISSRYMASDENTVKIADELGINFITARGTTELATTIYKPEEYNVRIISVSNIDVPEFKYGSFCDYSFYERGGNPEDMAREYARAIQEEKFIGVSHTYIGGYKARWNSMWHNFWDNYEVNWVNLDTLGTIDKTMPMWQIPVNKNAPYTPEKIRPVIPYEEEENVVNPCLVENLIPSNAEGNSEIRNIEGNEIAIFHNNTGLMCKEALDFFKINNISFEEHLTSDLDFNEILQSFKTEISSSEGLSSNFGYYPIIFVGEKAFSGFNDEIKNEILELIGI